MQGASEVVQGVFMDGFEEARFGIRTGSKQSDQFRSATPAHMQAAITAVSAEAAGLLFH